MNRFIRKRPTCRFDELCASWASSGYCTSSHKCLYRHHIGSTKLALFDFQQFKSKANDEEVKRLINENPNKLIWTTCVTSEPTFCRYYLDKFFSCNGGNKALCSRVHPPLQRKTDLWKVTVWALKQRLSRDTVGVVMSYFAQTYWQEMLAMQKIICNEGQLDLPVFPGMTSSQVPCKFYQGRGSCSNSYCLWSHEKLQ